MGHPPGAVTLPADGYRHLAAALDGVRAAPGVDPAELAALLGAGTAAVAPPPSQLAAIAWVLDAPARHVLLVHHPVLGWTCPGGHVHHGEEPVAAAARELAEETGLALAARSERLVTLSCDDLPADGSGRAHRHWVLGYRFTGDPAAPLREEPGRPARWFAVDRLPAGVIADVPDLLPIVRDAATSGG